MKKGETCLLPAMIKEITLVPAGMARVLEVYIESEDPQV